MGEGGPGASAGDIVAALRAVPGVADAEIAPDGRPGGAGTLRLTLEPGSDEVAVAAAVNRVLRERFGLAVDAERVAVVDESTLRRPRRSGGSEAREQGGLRVEGAGVGTQAQPGGAGAGTPPGPSVGGPVQAEGVGPSIGTEGVGPSISTEGVGPSIAAEGVRPSTSTEGRAGLRPVPGEITLPPAQRNRLLIEKLQLTSADLTVDVEVSLAFQGTAYVGSARSGATPSSIHRAVAQATLRAVETCIGAAARFEVEHLEVSPMGSERAVVVEISMVTRRGSERFTGVSAVRDDVRAAVVRASLAALNRRLESFLVPA
ncbi:MAG TPA: hypothetical protein VMI11_03840 [Actinomycetes bacterium]|nr:hypothetical protein [Actinomycetes bacterium]